MSSVSNYTLLAAILLGYVALWITIFNRTHAFNIPCRWIRVTELLEVLAANVPSFYLAWRFTNDPTLAADPGQLLAEWRWLAPIGLLCVLYLAWICLHWSHGKWFRERPAQLLSNHTDSFNIARELGHAPMCGWSTRAFALIPANQMFDLVVNEKTLVVPRLPAALDGLTITHLSDLHFTGKITRPYFDAVFDRAQALDGDLIAITGDILEAESCFAWLPETLGRLRARNGVYFVLGNHDKRLRDVGRLGRELTQLGLVDLGASWRQLFVRGERVLLCGNELPWFGPALEPPPADGNDSLRVLLSHGPDQIAWARQRDFDLMLAGHTHGGHIRLPIIGPIVCPSRYGVKYASGVFFEPPTLLHVSRGISGLDPLRILCPPELTKLVLRCPTNHE